MPVNYNITPVNVQPVDIGRTLGAVAQLQGVQQRNRLLTMQEQEASRKVDDRNRLTSAIPKAMQGDKEAMSQVAAINPEMWAKLETTQREKIKANIETTGRLLYQVEQAPEQDRPAAFAQARQIAEQSGVDMSQVPAQYDPNWVRSRLAQSMTVTEQIKLAEGNKPQVVGRDLVQTRGGKAEVLHTAEAPEDRTLVEIADETSPTGTRMVPRAQAVGQPGKPAGGMTLASDGKGGFTLTQGRSKADNSGMAQPTVNKIEEKQLDAGSAIARLSTIDKSFKPEFLKLKPRAGMAVAAMKDFVGLELDPAQQKSLSEFTEFRRATTTNLNHTIKELTGSAMGVQEADRIISTMPNAGTGVFDGDAPTQFKSKLDGAMKDVRHAVMRYSWARKNGVDPLKSNIELSDMPKLVDKRGAEIEQEIKSQHPGATPEQIRMERNARVASEFGLAN